MKLLLWPFAWWCRRIADKIDREYRWEYPVGTLGAEWKSLASKLRNLAEDIAR